MKRETINVHELAIQPTGPDAATGRPAWADDVDVDDALELVTVVVPVKVALEVGVTSAVESGANQGLLSAVSPAEPCREQKVDRDLMSL